MANAGPNTNGSQLYVSFLPLWKKSLNDWSSHVAWRHKSKFIGKSWPYVLHLYISFRFNGQDTRYPWLPACTKSINNLFSSLSIFHAAASFALSRHHGLMVGRWHRNLIGLFHICLTISPLMQPYNMTCAPQNTWLSALMSCTTACIHWWSTPFPVL